MLQCADLYNEFFYAHLGTFCTIIASSLPVEQSAQTKRNGFSNQTFVFSAETRQALWEGDFEGVKTKSEIRVMKKAQSQVSSPSVLQG